jgi:hypothetical protein
VLGLPGEEETDVAGHPFRIFQHLSPEVEAEWSKVIAPEFVAGTWSTLQGLVPIGPAQARHPRRQVAGAFRTFPVPGRHP